MTDYLTRVAFCRGIKYVPFDFDAIRSSEVGTLEMLLDPVLTDRTTMQTHMEGKHQVKLEQALQKLVERSSVPKITIQCTYDPDWNEGDAAEKMVRTMFPELDAAKRLDVEV